MLSVVSLWGTATGWPFIHVDRVCAFSLAVPLPGAFLSLIYAEFNFIFLSLTFSFLLADRFSSLWFDLGVYNVK